MEDVLTTVTHLLPSETPKARLFRLPARPETLRAIVLDT